MTNLRASADSPQIQKFSDSQMSTRGWGEKLFSDPAPVLHCELLGVGCRIGDCEPTLHGRFYQLEFAVMVVLRYLWGVVVEATFCCL